MPSDLSDMEIKFPSPAEVSELVRTAFSEAAAEGILGALHRFELTIRDNMEWPWMRWKHLGVDDAAYLDALPAVPPLLTDNELATNILNAGLCARRGEQNEGEADAIKSLFADKGLVKASSTEGASIQLELLMLAVHERKWPVVEALARRLIALQDIKGEKSLDACLSDLLLEVLFFSIYRPYMPYFVPKPEPLIEKLSALEKLPAVERLLEKGSRAALTYRANMAAMRGDFDAALPLYAEIALMRGFRSPVFQQTQVLLDVKDLTAENRQADMKWYHDRSTVSHHFPEPPEGQHAILVAVEPDYLKHYGRIYAEIVGTTNPDALIHFHLVNFAGDKQDTIDELTQIASTASVRINYSFEQNQIMQEKPQLKGGVCVNTRYIYLPEYLDIYAGVTITDIDGWLVKPLSGLTDFGECDSLVSSWVWKQNTGYWRLPWGNLSGGYCSIRSTDRSKQFAALIAQYLARLFARNAYSGKPLFYADQAAHFLCLKKAESEFGMKVGFIGGGFSQADELPFHDRHAGKLQAMRKKLEELKTANKG